MSTKTPPSKSQIRWQCRRGMLELDFLLERFVEKHFDTLSDEDKHIFSQLLQQEDPVLCHWLLDAQPPENKAFQRLITLIR